jgi:hypothetical protein
MYERKKKAIPNRTIGLQTKIISDAFTDEVCKTCNGSGKYKVYFESKSIRNLKNELGHVCLENDCLNCTDGVIRTKIRVIRKNNVRAIL